MFFCQFVEHGLRISRRPYALSTVTRLSLGHGRSKWRYMEAISYITSVEGAFSTRIGLSLPLTVLESRCYKTLKSFFLLFWMKSSDSFFLNNQFQKKGLFLGLTIKLFEYLQRPLYIDSIFLLCEWMGWSWSL